MIQLLIAAYLCGLGEIGYSKMFPSPQYGPRNRIDIVLTAHDAEIDETKNVGGFMPHLSSRRSSPLRRSTTRGFRPTGTPSPAPARPTAATAAVARRCLNKCSSSRLRHDPVLAKRGSTRPSYGGFRLVIG